MNTPKPSASSPLLASTLAKRLLNAHLPYKKRLFFAVIAMIMTALTEPLVPYVFKLFLDHGFVTHPPFPFWWIPVVIMSIFLIRGLGTFTSAYMMTWVSARFLNQLREQLFLRLLDVPVSFYTEASQSGKLINTLMSEAQQISEMVTKVFTAMIRSTLTIMGLTAWLFYINWTLTLITLLLIPAVAWVVRKTNQRLKRLNHTMVAVNAEMTHLIEEGTRTQQVIKIFGGQPYEHHRFCQRADNLQRTTMRMITAFASTVPITQIMTACAVSIVVMIAFIQSGQGEITMGGFMSFIAAMLMLLTPLKQLVEINGPLQRGMVAAETLFNLMDHPLERSNGRVLTQPCAGKIEFVDVSFDYGKTPVLKNICLSIQPREIIAIVGMSGGGKSTLVNLVPEFYSPQRGMILLDGQPIHTIALKSLRAQIAMVSQQVVLFDDTLLANIAYGDLTPDPERLDAAVRGAYLEAIVAGLPEKLHTRIGHNGARLSGGQRQRVAIARAIYKNAPILILDEATSALDNEAERAVQAALDHLVKNRTTLVIAHRLSTIEKADRIVVLSHGEIVEIGTHQSLLAQKGVYAKLYHVQFSQANTP